MLVENRLMENSKDTKSWKQFELEFWIYWLTFGFGQNLPKDTTKSTGHFIFVKGHMNCQFFIDIFSVFRKLISKS